MRAGHARLDRDAAAAAAGIEERPAAAAVRAEQQRDVATSVREGLSLLLLGGGGGEGRIELDVAG